MVGYDDRRRPVLWTEAGGTVTLAGLPAGPDTGFAEAVSADGSTAVGLLFLENRNAAAVWTAAGELQLLSSILEAQGVDLAGWSLTEATAISGDGRYVGGSGIHNGNTEGFIADIWGGAEPPCYLPAAPVEIDLPREGAGTNLNLLPLLGAYLSTSRPASAPRWTADTPVEQLFANTNAGAYIDISGTLGSARFVSRTNKLGVVDIPLVRDIGYASYVNQSVRICGVHAGRMSVRIHRPLRFVVSPREAGRISFRLNGMPGSTYRILRSDRAANFTPWASVVTGDDGSFSGLSFLDQQDQPPSLFFKAEEVSR